MGIGCEEDFGAALLGLLPGVDQPVAGTLSPLDARYSLTGSAALGPEWAVAIAPGHLLVGTPMGGAVRSFDVELDTDDRDNDADGVITGERSDDEFGASLAVAADLDGDGVPDLLVGAPSFTLASDTRHDGAVYLFSGLGEGFVGKVAAADADIRFAGQTSGGRLGERLAICPDLDGDDRGEWLATAPWDNTAAALSGRVVLGLSTETGDLSSQALAGALSHSWTGSDIGERAGESLLCSHDLTGDGIPDLLIGAPFADGDAEAVGAVYVLSGAALPASGPLSEVATMVIRGVDAQGWLGWSIAAGDIDGDGMAEVAIGAPGRDQNTGRVLVWKGTDFPLGEPPSFSIAGEALGDGFGRALAFADLTGDGFDELFIGAPFVNPTDEDSAFDSGHLVVFRGDADFSGFSPEMDAGDASIRYEDAKQYLRTGQRFVTGDFDGDAQADLVLVHRTAPE